MLGQKNNLDETIVEEGSPRQLALKFAEHWIRFSALANAGGVVATMTTLGAPAKDGEIVNILALPLALFAAGVLCALLGTCAVALVGQKMIKGKEFENSRLNKVLSQLNEWGEFIAYGMILFFVLGCVTGVGIIAFA